MKPKSKSERKFQNYRRSYRYTKEENQKIKKYKKEVKQNNVRI
jgi:hypothetical protein